MSLYNPRHFRIDDIDESLAFIKRHDFAIVVSHQQMTATHTPMTATMTDGRLELFGHFARLNPHCKLLDGTCSHTCIFAGPHTYVSPTWYKTVPAVPTWNYSAVHVTGTASIIEDQQIFKDKLLELTQKHDPDANTSELMPEKYMRGMMKGIIGFTLQATSIEMKHKLSQNRSTEDQQAVADQLGLSDQQDAQEIAKAMQRNLCQR